eukprot:c16465_g2_i1 orf=1-192(-)
MKYTACKSKFFRSYGYHFQSSRRVKCELSALDAPFSLVHAWTKPGFSLESSQEGQDVPLFVSPK